MRKKKPIDPSLNSLRPMMKPRSLGRYDTMDYPQAFRTIKVVSELRNRHCEIPIGADVIVGLRRRARKAGVPLGRLASELLRKEL